MSQTVTKGILAIALLSGLAGTAFAGGFSRGDADTDLIYEDGAFDMRFGATLVAPKRDFATINGAAGTDDVYTNNYIIPNFGAKLKVSDRFSCVGTYTQPFGASSDYGPQSQQADIIADIAAGRIPNAVKHADFETNEYGATCGVNMEAGSGKAWLLGGVFVQDFDYTEVKTLGTLNLRDNGAAGYRIGAAYEIQEYALRAELMYRSQIDIDANGTFRNAVPLPTPIPGVTVPVGTLFPSTGTGSLPQSVELNLQSGIAPGWLAYGSVKWTDWSVLQTLNYNITNLGPNTKDFFWQDGWTVQAGIAHAFTDEISGTANITWDRGVGTGADIMTDTWTFGAGTQIKAGPGALRLGGAISYLTSGSQSTSNGASFDATADGDWAYALGGSYTVKF